MLFRLVLALALLPLAAFAQDAIDPDTANDGDGTQIVVPAKPEHAPPTDLRPADPTPTVQVDSEVCRYATAHAGEGDYVPGIDANGNPVAPADMQSDNQLQLPPRFAIPITTNVARMLRTSTATPQAATATSSSVTQSNGGTGSGFRADAYVGLITADNGRLFFNGQPIGDESDADLAAACRSAAPKKSAGAQ